MKQWINAFRLHTLPLAFSCIIVGGGIAAADGYINIKILVLAFVTTLLLQVLSNLANDYGDFVKGADNENRIGSRRALQSGLISESQMIKAICIISMLCSLSGVWLIYEGIKGLGIASYILFAIFGIIAIIAALKYTMGKNPYGYAGMGDLFVFIFFGLLGVLGTYFLHAHLLYWALLLPATAVGLLSTAVLNINNMRDHIEDEKSGKNTVVVRMGINRAKWYHLALNLLGVLFMVSFSGISWDSLILFIAGIILFGNLTISIIRCNELVIFNLFLKKQAMFTFIYSALFVLTLYIR
jgi:1,4-dihydroxy-2-naphthoate octaprenyltransferase